MSQNIQVDRQQMMTRVARYRELPDYRAMLRAARLPEAAIDMFGPDRILQVMGPAVHGVSPFAITEPSGLISFAETAPGTGPALHSHSCVETFVVMRGRFCVRWGDEGEQRVDLDTFDTISIPPGVMRTFENIGDDDGTLMAVLTGRDLLSFTFPSAVARRLSSVLSPVVMKLLSIGGMVFQKR